MSDSLTNLGNHAFKNCHELTSVTLPDTLTKVEHNTFENCTKLASVTLPDTLTTIDWSGFNGCTALVSVTLPQSVIHHHINRISVDTPCRYTWCICRVYREYRYTPSIHLFRYTSADTLRVHTRDKPEGVSIHPITILDTPVKCIDKVY